MNPGPTWPADALTPSLTVDLPRWPQGLQLADAQEVPRRAATYTLSHRWKGAEQDSKASWAASGVAGQYPLEDTESSQFTELPWDGV